MTANAADNRYLLDTIADPVSFVRKILRHKVWSKQADILTALSRSRRVKVKACHASGKTFCAAEAVLWWITRYPDGIAVTTAPTWTQVRRLLWLEIHRAMRQSRITYPEPGQTSLMLSPDNYAIGLSTNEGVRFQGFHGRVLIVLDEAPGVLTEIYEAIEGVRAGGDVRVLELGNPTIASGPFYEGFVAGRNSPGTETLTISAFDTPNLDGLTLDDLLALPDDQLDVNPWPMLTTRRWVREKHEEWGTDHPLWQSRVMGQFPEQSEDSLISLAWLEAAKYRECDNGSYPDVVGIDVAGPGEDETVICWRRGPNVKHMRGWTQADPRGEVEAELKTLGLNKAKTTLRVDSIGMGHYFAAHFRDLGWRVESVNVAESPRNREQFTNLKGEYYWGLRDRFKSGDVRGFDYERAISQLAAIRYRHNSRGQVVVESKDEMRKRGVAKSPDWAEAVMLAFGESHSPVVLGGLPSLAAESYYHKV